MALILCLSLAGCGKKVPAQDPAGQAAEGKTYEFELENAGTANTADAADTASGGIEPASETDSSEGTLATQEPQQAGAGDASEPLIDEDGSYTTKEDVAVYIHTYGKLPSNFITKKQAGKLGWSGGSLEEYAPGKCIGGDRFGNYEGLLPEDKEYHECDIGTLGKKKRGAKRIIYSDDGYIYYTEDHYESFELLYEP